MRRWTLAEDAELARLWEEGLFVRDIAARMGIAIDTVRRRRRRLCLPERPRGRSPAAAERDRELARLWEEGVPKAEIASRLGICMSFASARRKALGLPMRRGGSPPVPEERDRELARLWKEGLPVAEIAARLGISGPSVSRRRTDLGLPPRKPAGRPRKPAGRPRKPAGRPRKADLRFAPRPAWLPLLPIRSVPPGPDPKSCQWIDGDPLEAGWRMCGLPVEAGRPYCPAHVRRAYRTATEEEAA